MQVLTTTKAAPISFSPLRHRYTLEEFYELPDPEGRAHYELIGGYLFMVPPPAPPHGSIDARMVKLLIKFLVDHNIDGEVHHPRESIYQNDEGGTYLEPDMMFVSAELRKTMGSKRSSADIVFEYLSKSSAVYDSTTKADTYLHLGVRELWLVDSTAQSIEVRYASREGNDLVWERWLYEKGDLAESRVLEGWKVSVEELFEGLSQNPEQ